MKKLEPGMVCRVVVGELKGEILTLVRFVGNPKPKIVGGVINTFSGGDWWETDAKLPWPGDSELAPDGLFPARELEPINPDHQPADEEWQADFRRMLDKSGEGSHAKTS